MIDEAINGSIVMPYQGDWVCGMGHKPTYFGTLFDLTQDDRIRVSWYEKRAS